MKNFTRTVLVRGKKLKASVNHINALYKTMWPLLNSTANYRDWNQLMLEIQFSHYALINYDTERYFD